MPNYPVSIFTPEAQPIQQGIAIFHETQPATVNAGDFNSGSWITRGLNTVQSSQPWASLSSSQVTLDSGSYLFEATAVMVGVNESQLQIYNVTDTVSEVLGDVQLTFPTTNQGGVNCVSGIVTITVQSVFELQHQCGATKTSFGLGVGSPWAVGVFSILKITKLT